MAHNVDVYKTMGTKESNRDILNFMGYRSITPDLVGINLYENDKGDTQELLCVKYHSSWDWLMPVVEKIETLNYAVTITQNICTIGASVMGDRTVVVQETGNYMEENTKLSNTHKAVVKFIQWYNEKLQ